MARERPIRDMLAMSAGFIAWAAQFTLIYGINAVACARGFARVDVLGIGLVPLAIGGATALALGVAAFVLVRAQARRKTLEEHAGRERFVATVAAYVSGFALVAILWHGLPALIVPVCS